MNTTGAETTPQPFDTELLTRLFGEPKPGMFWQPRGSGWMIYRGVGWGFEHRGEGRVSGDAPTLRLALTAMLEANRVGDGDAAGLPGLARAVADSSLRAALRRL